MSLHINIEDLLSAKTVESDRIEFKEGWNPDAVYRSICAFANDFDNTGGGYVLIGTGEKKGVAKRPVKELKLTEGKATGIPVILKTLKDNGSPAPHFDTDADRSFFEIEIFKHPAASINDGGKNIAGTGAQSIEKLAARLSDSLGSHLSPHLSPHLSSQTKETVKILLLLEKEASKRGEIMEGIKKFNNTREVKQYIEPLEEIGWISKTIPDKPSSKHQRYALTAKGKKLLKELKG